jgi:type IV secretory pathway TrbL component
VLDMPDALAVLEALAPPIDSGVVAGFSGGASVAFDFGGGEAAAMDATDDEADNGAGATGATSVAPDARDTVAAAAAMKAVRFSPHSTQKRAPVTTGAPHCGQNRTVTSGPDRAGGQVPPK